MEGLVLPKNKWLERDEERNSKGKNEIIQLIITEFLSRELSTLAGASNFLAVTALKQGLIDDKEVYYQAFDTYHAEKNNQALARLFSHLSYGDLLGICKMDMVPLPKQYGYQSHDINADDIDRDTLTEYLEASATKIAISVAHVNQPVTASPSSVDSAKSFPIHSVGKVFTGALTLKMIQQGIISEEALSMPPQFSEEVTKFIEAQLPNVSAILKKCTLRDLMLHQSGLGDYLTPYCQKMKDEIESAKKEDRDPVLPIMENPEGFLRFAEDNIFELDSVSPISGEQQHYSNLGILLVGLATQHAYNLQASEAKTYAQLLHQHILEPAGITSFSVQNPGDGIVNPEDPIAQHIAGSPAGGYWMNVEDLCKFGQWLSSESKNEDFLRLLNAHGGEFYDKSKNVILHSGITSSSAMLKCYLNTGTTVAILSEEPLLAPNFTPQLEDHVCKDTQLKHEQVQRNHNPITPSFFARKRSQSLPDLRKIQTPEDKSEKDKKESSAYNPFSTKPRF